MKTVNPRAMVGVKAKAPMPRVNVTQQVSAGKKAPATPKAKTTLKISPANPPKQPKAPALFQPLGGGTGEENPQVTPRNSQKGIKQRTPTKNPFGAL